MTKQDFITLMQQQEPLTTEQTELLKTLVDEFPYSQTIKALYLKGLKNTDSYLYNESLKVTAAYTAHRSILFDYITSDHFKQHRISEIIQSTTAEAKSIPLENENTSEVPELKPIDFNSEPQDKPEAVSLELAKEEQTEQAKNNTILNIGKPLDFNTNERHSFKEWLQITATNSFDTPEISTENSEEEDPEKAKKFELIDQFIKNNPKIDPNKSKVTTKNIAKDNLISTDELMTETLARVYIEQKNYEKAIQSYKILSLKYPEKSGYFADQIKAIKKLDN